MTDKKYYISREYGFGPLGLGVYVSGFNKKKAPKSMLIIFIPDKEGETL